MSDIARDRFEEHPYGWVIVAVSTVCLALGFGAGGSVSVFIKPFEQEFGWLRADTSMAYTMHTIGAALGGLVWGSLSDRIGARNIGLLGAAAHGGGSRSAAMAERSLAALRDFLSDRRHRLCLPVHAGARADRAVVQRAQGPRDRHCDGRRRHRPGHRALSRAAHDHRAGMARRGALAGRRVLCRSFPADVPAAACAVRRTGERRAPTGRIPTSGACRTRSPFRGSASPDCSVASAWPCRWCTSCRSASISDAARRRRRACCCR